MLHFTKEDPHGKYSKYSPWGLTFSEVPSMRLYHKRLQEGDKLRSACSCCLLLDILRNCASLVDISYGC